jgi:hypothetical protein
MLGAKCVKKRYKFVDICLHISTKYYFRHQQMDKTNTDADTYLQKTVFFYFYKHIVTF